MKLAPFFNTAVSSRLKRSVIDWEYVTTSAIHLAPNWMIDEWRHSFIRCLFIHTWFFMSLDNIVLSIKLIIQNFDAVISLRNESSVELL